MSKALLDLFPNIGLDTARFRIRCMWEGVREGVREGGSEGVSEGGRE